MTMKTAVDMKDRTFNSKDSVSIIIFLLAFKVALMPEISTKRLRRGFLNSTSAAQMKLSSTRVSCFQRRPSMHKKGTWRQIPHSSTNRWSGMRRMTTLRQAMVTAVGLSKKTWRWPAACSYYTVGRSDMEMSVPKKSLKSPFKSPQQVDMPGTISRRGLSSRPRR